MNLTKHANKRKQQRGISKSTIDLIKRYGRERTKPGNAIEISIPIKGVKKLIETEKKLSKQRIHELERTISKGVLVIENTIITTYHKSQ